MKCVWCENNVVDDVSSTNLCERCLQNLIGGSEMEQIREPRRVVVRPRGVSGKGQVENVKALKVLIRNQNDNTLRNSLMPSEGKRVKVTKKEIARVSRINW